MQTFKNAEAYRKPIYLSSLERVQVWVTAIVRAGFLGLGHRPKDL